NPTTKQPTPGKHNPESLLHSYLFASTAFESETDREWLRKRFAMLRDIVRETWAYQEIIQEGREAGLQQGRQEGHEEGFQAGLQQGQQEKLDELRQALLDIVQERFPKMVRLVRHQIASIQDSTI